MTRESLRSKVLAWVIFLALTHILVGFLLTFLSNVAAFNNYHQQIIAGFGFDITDAKALALHRWWLNLFGATLQNLGLLMLLLIFVANKFRYAKLWLWMVIGLLVWGTTRYMDFHAHSFKLASLVGYSCALAPGTATFIFVVYRHEK